MSNLDEKTELKKYLLGTVKETEAIEKRILTDEDYFQELEMVEEELIQDFADGNLSPKENTLFEQNFVLTPERAKKLAFAKNLRTYIDKNPESISKPKKNGLIDSLRAFFSSPIPVAFATILIAGIAGYFVWNQYYRESEILVSLNKVYKNERPTEGRITGFDYAPKTEGTRGANDKAENLDLVSAKARATEAVLKNQTAENYHELGRVYLAEKNFDEAIKNFEKGIKKDSNIARLHNDLGVTFMEKANTKDEGKLELLAKANEEFAKAINLDKDSLESIFNQALCIESLNLPNQSKEAWENYLKLDSTSKWADEAREYLKKLEENKPISKTKEDVLRDFLAAKDAHDEEKAWEILSRNREMITGKLIPQQLAFLFVDSKVNGDETNARTASDTLIYIGKLEEEKSGDLFWRDLADYYKNVSNQNISNLKIAHNEFNLAYELRSEKKLEKSLESFTSAKKTFKKLGNFLEERICDYWRASLLFQLNQVEKSNAIHLVLSGDCESKNYKWLATQSYVRLSYGVSSENRHSKSIEYNEKARTYAVETNDLYNLQRIYTSFAYDYKVLGRYDTSIEFAEKSLIIGTFPESSNRQKWLDYEAITETLFAENHYSTAITFQNEAVSLDKVIHDDYYRQTSSVYLGILYSAKKDFGTAEIYLEESIKLAETFSDEPVKVKALAFSKLNYAHLKRLSGKFEEAISMYEESNKFISTSEFQLDTYDGEKGRLLSYIATKDEFNINKSLPKVLGIFQEYRAKILEEQNRNSFFDNEQSVYDVAIDYELSKSGIKKAFDYSEESRSRSLLDLQNSVFEVSKTEKQPQVNFSKKLSQPLKLEEIQAEMPKSTQLLEYSILQDKVIIWLITSENFDIAVTEIAADKLQEQILKYRDQVSGNVEPGEQIKIAKELYRLLILPIKDKLDSNKQLFIVPDKSLTQLPFSTLFSDKYLIEEFSLSFSPSANVFLHCSKKAKEFDVRKQESLLSIGNPAFDRNEYENKLQPLPASKIEAETIAEVYPKSTILTENEATKDRIIEGLKTADVIHFAGHYLVDERSPLLSSFVLAGKKESNLKDYEIMAEKLSSTRLVVLSGCDTGFERFYQGEGIIGASRIFLAAGVPIVVASQWSVDSEATKELMIMFHQLRKTAKLSSSEALRHSQLKMIKGGKYQQPFFWAAFASIGGFTVF
jgi:CHAT domain-containing protein